MLIDYCVCFLLVCLEISSKIHCDQLSDKTISINSHPYQSIHQFHSHRKYTHEVMRLLYNNVISAMTAVTTITTISFITVIPGNVTCINA